MLSMINPETISRYEMHSKFQAQNIHRASHENFYQNGEGEHDPVGELQRSADKKGAGGLNLGISQTYSSAHKRPASAAVTKTKVKNNLVKSNQKQR